MEFKEDMPIWDYDYVIITYQAAVRQKKEEIIYLKDNIKRSDNEDANK
jgi:hypothetical protein